MSSRKGFMVLDVLLGMVILLVMTELLLADVSLKKASVFDPRCDQMSEMWTDESYEEICSFKKEPLIELPGITEEPSP